jgi:hypothetical protein
MALPEYDSLKKEHIPDRIDNNSTEFGKTGLKTTGGRIHEEFLRQFRDLPRRVAALTELHDNEPLISGTFFAIKQLIKHAEWRVEPGGTRLKDKKTAEFVDSCLHDMSMSWEDVLDEILSFVLFGFSLHEIVYKFRSGPQNPDPMFRSQFRDGRIGWSKLPIRAQDTIEKWLYTDDGTLMGVEQIVNNSFVAHNRMTIPMQKLLLFKTVSYKENPEGRSTFRASWVPYFYKKQIQNVEAIGIERELNGLPVASVPSKIMGSDASAAEQAVYESYKTTVKNIRTDEQAGIVVPSDRDDKGHLIYDFALLSTQGRRAIDTEQVIARLNRELLISIMADFLLLGHESVGSFALSSDKTRLFAIAIEGFMEQVKNIFNKHAIPRLLAVNGISVEALPTLEHSDIETEPIKDIAESMKWFVEAGVDLGDDEIKGELLRRAGISAMPDITKPEPAVGEVNDG